MITSTFLSAKAAGYRAAAESSREHMHRLHDIIVNSKNPHPSESVEYSYWKGKFEAYTLIAYELEALVRKEND